MPTYTDINAPPNEYSSGFDDVSEMVRKQSGWKCDNCGLDLSQNHKYLHTHHINSIKSDNRQDNLRSLCIKCHSDQPDHLQLKWSYDYNNFMNEFGDYFNE